MSALGDIVNQMVEAGVSFDEAMFGFKRLYMISALLRHRCNQCATAAELGVHRNTVSRALDELRIDIRSLRALRRSV